MRNYFILSILFTAFNVFAQQGHHIEIEVANYDNDFVVLGYHLGDKQYIQDTSFVDKGKFTFKGEEALEPGMYLLILPPKNDYCQIIIPEDDQSFQFSTDTKNLVANVKVKDSQENELFYDYMHFLNEARTKVEPLRKQIDSATGDTKKSLEAKLKKVDTDVKQYQSDLENNHSQTMAAAIIKAGKEIKLPEFKGDEKEVQLKKYQYYKAHYFDHIDLGDPRLLRTPILNDRINYYLTKLTSQHPDSINVSLDYLLGKLEPAEQSFKYYLIHYLNFYAQSKLVGMDAVYVHLVDNYYAEGKALWTDEEQALKIVDNANTLRPILIGKIAPNIKMKKKDNTDIALHDVKSKYTIMFFWDPDCGHCKKSMPGMIDFYNNYKSKDVEIFAICTKLGTKVDSCWETIDEKGMGNWMNVVDPFLISRYKSVYDVKTTPRIFVLDKDKKILSKRIGIEQLPEVMEAIMKN